MITTFLSGAIVALHLVAALFFLKFWHRTRDWLFVAFAVAFGIEGLNRIRFLFVEHPNEGNFGIYAVRMLVFLGIVAAVVAKNFYQKQRQSDRR